jgi:ribokinase
MYALKMAKENACTTILNPAPARNLPEDCFENIDFFTPNETEASFFVNQSIESEEDCQSAAKVLLDKGVKNILITLGDKGCFFKNQEEEFLLPAKKLSAPVVDTTGAGDAFNGAFSVALSKNKNFKEAIEFANLVAGISVTREGAANSMPTFDEIEENLE